MITISTQDAPIGAVLSANKDGEYEWKFPTRKWIMKPYGRGKGRLLWNAWQDHPNGLTTFPGMKYNACLKFIRKYHNVDVDAVLNRIQKLPK